MIASKQIVDRARRVLHEIGTEIRMARKGEGESVFLKPLDTDRAKLVLDYVIHLEDTLARRAQYDQQSTVVAEKLGVAITALSEVKALPEMSPDMSVKAIRNILNAASAKIDG